MRRRLLIIIIVLAVILSVFIISGCSALSDSEANTNKQFVKMRPELVVRYKKLNDSLKLAETIGGTRDVTKDGLAAYKAYSKAVKNKNVNEELKYSRELENAIGRLRANASKSPRLQGSQELKDSITAIDEATVSKNAKDAYKKAANSYEDKRTSWRYLLSATFAGYSSKDTLEFSEPTK